MLGLVILGLLVSFFLIYLNVMLMINARRNIIRIRLNRIEKEEAQKDDSELSKPLFHRIIRPLLDDISKTVIRIAPTEVVSNFEKKVIKAGNPYNFTVKDWINFQVVVIFCLPLVTSALGYYKNIDTRTLVFIIIIEISLGMLLPNLLLSKNISDRQIKITNSLPDVIDLLTVSVEAGLGFDGALAKVVDKMPGPMALEFNNVLQEMKVGKPKRDALKDMADRVGI